MKIEVTEEGFLRLEEVYNPVIFRRIDEGHVSDLSVSMRDGGFEIKFNGANYSAQGDTIIQMP